MKTATAGVPATLAFAKGLFTRGTDVFGAEEIDRIFGLKLGRIPSIPFSEAELTRARELDQYLILQVDTTKHAKPLTMKRLHEELANRLGDGKLLYDTDWYVKEPFFTEDTPRLGWALVSREVIPGSASQDYIGQTQAISDYLVKQVFKGEELPDEYQAAVSQFETQKEQLERLRDKDWKTCAEKCGALKLNQLFREKPVEVLYGLIVQHEINHERLLGNMWTWTQGHSSLGHLVRVGYGVSDGVYVSRYVPGRSDSRLGVLFFRSAVSN